MKKKILLKTMALIGTLSPIATVIACGNSTIYSNDPYVAQSQELAQKSAEWMSKIDSTNASFADFPNPDLTTPVVDIAKFAFINPINKPEVPLQLFQTIPQIFVLNKNNDNPDAPTVEIQYFFGAGVKINAAFSDYGYLKISKFAQMLDLTTVPDITVNPGDVAVKTLQGQESAAKADVITALNTLALNQVKNQLVTVADSDFNELVWTLGDEAKSPIPDTSDLKNNQTSYKATITAKADSTKIKNSQEITVTIPKLNQYDLTIFTAPYDAPATDFDSLSSKSAVPRQELEDLIKRMVLALIQLKNSNATQDDFTMYILKTDNAGESTSKQTGILDDFTDLTNVVTKTYIGIQIFSLIRNPNLIGANSSLGDATPGMTIISIPKLT